MTTKTKTKIMTKIFDVHENRKRFTQEQIENNFDDIFAILPVNLQYIVDQCISNRDWASHLSSKLMKTSIEIRDIYKDAIYFITNPIIIKIALLNKSIIEYIDETQDFPLFMVKELPIKAKLALERANIYSRSELVAFIKSGKQLEQIRGIGKGLAAEIYRVEKLIGYLPDFKGTQPVAEPALTDIIMTGDEFRKRLVLARMGRESSTNDELYRIMEELHKSISIDRTIVHIEGELSINTLEYLKLLGFHANYIKHLDVTGISPSCT